MDKIWLDNLLKFFPKSMLNVEKMWDNEWNSYAIIVCDVYLFPDINDKKRGVNFFIIQ